MNGSALCDLLALQNESEGPNNLEVDECPFDLDDDDLFGSIGIETFSVNIDAILSTSELTPNSKYQTVNLQLKLQLKLHYSHFCKLRIHNAATAHRGSAQ